LAWLGRRLSAAGTSASRRCVIGAVCASGSVALTRQLGRHRPAPPSPPAAAAEGIATPPSAGDAFGGSGGAEGGGGDGGNMEGQRTYSTEYVPVRCCMVRAESVAACTAVAASSAVPMSDSVRLCMFQLLAIEWQMRAFVGHCCVSRNHCAASHDAAPFGELSGLNAMRRSACNADCSPCIRIGMEWNGIGTPVGARVRRADRRAAGRAAAANRFGRGAPARRLACGLAVLCAS
jgi:hypothetical protein